MDIRLEGLCYPQGLFRFTRSASSIRCIFLLQVQLSSYRPFVQPSVYGKAALTLNVSLTHHTPIGVGSWLRWNISPSVSRFAGWILLIPWITGCCSGLEQIVLFANQITEIMKVWNVCSEVGIFAFPTFVEVAQVTLALRYLKVS